MCFPKSWTAITDEHYISTSSGMLKVRQTPDLRLAPPTQPDIACSPILIPSVSGVGNAAPLVAILTALPDYGMPFGGPFRKVSRPYQI
ncbi:hypothetical protein M407DRAFT_245604 [Tulasnella calospora MUT 4182]|uniref:Uncharacterized protein n=1 Tax=Tulasnella calospora MUT 4182 TaxID=1051891 RepID=A0A0C3PZP1_9AGAM|nr:hypothetical protein M407DRAFT_245604 [Tulasnella calospora MUT 4182]